MSIVTDAPVLQRPAAPYQQIADYYRTLIGIGELQAGDRLPPILRLTEMWQVSTGTAHKALQVLQREGLVESTRRGGTTVVPTEWRSA